jgi:hypothetical protein
LSQGSIHYGMSQEDIKEEESFGELDYIDETIEDEVISLSRNFIDEEMQEQRVSFKMRAMQEISVESRMKRRSMCGLLSCC